jgi:nucleoside-diphosphate-sugar epimerase
MAAKILVTGADGFIGKALCRRLKKLGHDVTPLNRKTQDITKPFTLTDEFDFVFHLAAHNVTSVGEKETDLYYLVNVQGTVNVLKAVKTKRFVFLSTAKVYWSKGEWSRTRPLDENATVLPVNFYEKTKLAAEERCREVLKEKNLLILRAVNIAGHGQSDKAVIPVLFKKAMAGEPLEIFGPKDLVLQFLYVEDAVDAFIKVIEKGGLSGTYNFASSEKITLGELAVAIKDACGSKSEIRFMNEDQTVFSEVLSGKLERDLGWKAKTTIREILDGYC